MAKVRGMAINDSKGPKSDIHIQLFQI